MESRPGRRAARPRKRVRPPYTVDVGSKYGAPHGRPVERFDDLEKVHLRRVPINSQGYDPGGAYWGIGIPLWCAWTASGGVLYQRAVDRQTAKTLLEQNMLFADDCTWFR